MHSLVLEKLEWPHLLEHLAGFAKSEPAIEASRALSANLSREDIDKRWRQVGALKDMHERGFQAPIVAIPEMEKYFRAIELGSLLAGIEYRSIYQLLNGVKELHRFIHSLPVKFSTLNEFKLKTYPLPNLCQSIERTFDARGEVLDTASDNLFKIRQRKTTLRKKIEKILTDLIHSSSLETYLQDEFFTLRSDRYVVPMKLDGHGRINGSIYDTSASGQTLFIEPSSIAPLNAELIEIDLSEKLEILTIVRELNTQIAAEVRVIKDNYAAYVELDLLNAQAHFALQWNLSPVKLSDAPTLQLKNAKHPLIAFNQPERVIANDIALNDKSKALIISGPNAGGKTVVLKTAGLLHLMLKSGLMISADPESEMYVFDKIFVELGDAQNLLQSFSTFSGHIYGLKSVLATASHKDLVLLDELASGTEPHAGAALAQAILEKLVVKGCSCIVTTHFDRLKELAFVDKRFRNGSMEFSSKSHKPTYQLVLDLPGQSYGIEIAEQLDFDPDVIVRARELKGTSASRVDEIILQLSEERETLRRLQEAARKEKNDAETQAAHWQKEREALEEKRKDIASKMRQDLEEEIQSLKQENHQLLSQMKKTLHKLERHKIGDLDEEREALTGFEQKEKTISQRANEVADKYAKLGTRGKELPGEKVAFESLKPGQTVYVVSLAKDGVIQRLGKNELSPLDIKFGNFSMQVNYADVRLMPTMAVSPEKPQRDSVAKSSMGKRKEIPFTLKTSTNTLDLRGEEADAALDKTWRFIDQALLRGESSVVILHGHGQNILKNSIRTALAADNPYQLSFRPGVDQEGGDGVTVVAFK